MGTPVSSTYKTDRYDIAEILLKVVLNTITLTLNTCVNVLNIKITNWCYDLHIYVYIKRSYNFHSFKALWVKSPLLVCHLLDI